MILTVIRTFIIYCAVHFSVRLMGKRQLGELQPGELVITILVSEIAATPISDPDEPLLQSIIPLMLLVSFEIINSLISMKKPKFRYKTDGRPITVINDGKLNQKRLSELRFTIDDILAALRQKDIFDINEVQYAIVETNGMLSVLLKPPKRTATGENVHNPEKDTGMPTPVIIDGFILEKSIREANTERKEIIKKLERDNINLEKIVLMTVDKNSKYDIILKDEKKQ